MILLSFTSAAKYILSLMLAMLGIIPFEAVQPPSREPVDTPRSVNLMGDAPLDHMPAITELGPAFFNSGELHPEHTEWITMRDNYDMKVPESLKKLVYTVNYNSFSGELKSDPKHQQIRIIYSCDTIEDSKGEVIVIQSGI